jgi:hypothetical protein
VVASVPPAAPLAVFAAGPAADQEDKKQAPQRFLQRSWSFANPPNAPKSNTGGDATRPNLR